jgi:hypothetical protein
LAQHNGGQTGASYSAQAFHSAAQRPIRRWRSGGILICFPLSVPTFPRLLLLVIALVDMLFEHSLMHFPDIVNRLHYKQEPIVRSGQVNVKADGQGLNDPPAHYPDK